MTDDTARALPTPTFDTDGYPTEETLRLIEEWPHTDFEGLFAFIGAAWHEAADFTRVGNAFELHTGGWSGNESIIAALERNAMAWLMCAWSWRRGGHYEFRLPEKADA